MPLLRRLSLVTLNAERLAGFYEDVFAMKRVPNATGEALYLSDGYFNLTLVPNRAEGKPNGLNHFGFAVEDPEAIRRKFLAWSLAEPWSRPGKHSYADLRGTDPDGNNIDLSERGYPF